MVGSAVNVARVETQRPRSHAGSAQVSAAFWNYLAGYFVQSLRCPALGIYVQSDARNDRYAAVQASTLHCTCGSGATIGGAGGAGAAAAAGALGAAGAVRLGGTIGAPIGALGATGVTATGAGGGRTAGGACSPASVSAIGDIGADSQSSPSRTLPRVITSTAP